MTHRAKKWTMCLGTIIVVGTLIFLEIIMPTMVYSSVSLPKDMKIRDKIKDSTIVVRVTPTGNISIVGDDVKFRIVELDVLKELKGEVKNNISLNQTLGIKESPNLKMGHEYLLFLEPYIGDISIAEGTYVSECANWGYYEILDGEVVALYDELGDVSSWLLTKSKSGKACMIDDIAEWLNE